MRNKLDNYLVIKRYVEIKPDVYACDFHQHEFLALNKSDVELILLKTGVMYEDILKEADMEWDDSEENDNFY